MWLRDKKTGAIIKRNSIVTLECKITSCGSSLVEAEKFSSIEQLNDEWEDYRPTEPLIKDEKIRKAVRAWAKANGIERVWHECASCWLRGNGLSIEMENEVDELEQGNYSITELCGEEEE